MEPKIYIDKDLSKTSGKSEEMALCSCHECDTIRCFSSKEPNNEDDEKYTRTCIYFTNITIKQSNSNSNVFSSNMKSSDPFHRKESPSCEICKKEKENKESKNTKNTKNSQHNIDTTNHVCKICKNVMKDFNNIVDQKLKLSKVFGDENKVGIKNTSGKCSVLSDLVSNNDLECFKNLINELNSSMLNKMHTSSDTTVKSKSECEICKQNFRKNNTAKVACSRSSILNKTKAISSVCDVCLRDIDKLNNDVKIIFNNKKGLLSEVLRINNELNSNNTKDPTLINTRGPKLIPADNKHMRKPKCLSDVHPKCSFCAIKYGVTSREMLDDKKTHSKKGMQNNVETKCNLNRLDNNAIKLDEKTSNRISSQINNVNTVFNERYPNKANYYFQSQCKKCYKDMQTHRKIDAEHDDYYTSNVPAYVKTKGRKDETKYDGDVKNCSKTPTDTKLKCSNCGKEYEISHKAERRCNVANNEVDAMYSGGKEIYYDSFPNGKTQSIHSVCSLILCTCKSLGSLKKGKLERKCPVVNVHNATVSYMRNDINPSAAKLSAQIMNLPYEEFEESFNNSQQDDEIICPAQMKSNLSDEILKRIKDVYKACSCKICECIAGKSLQLDNVCNCKPCDCDDCKSFKKVNFFEQFRDESKQSWTSNATTELNFGLLRNQSCDCAPCACVKCTTPKTFIAARVSENRSANNCTCEACHCRDCERNFFSLSSHLTHATSTGGMVRNCGCDQCVDQRCSGAGGTEACRCEMPSKAICKPVEKETRDYDIRHASVHHTRCNGKPNTFNAIAMYASVSSNFPMLDTLKEACSCEECECVACEHEDNKVLLKTILKPRQEPYKQCIRVNTNTCVCKSCQCKICSYDVNKSETDIYQDKGCTCGECDCISCERMGSSSTAIKLSNVPKLIGKIQYKNKLSYESQVCDDTKPVPNGSLCTYRNKHVCMNATLDKNSFINNRDKNNEYKFYSDESNIWQCPDNDEPEKCLFSKAFCDLHHLKDIQLPSNSASMYGESSHNHYSVQNKKSNKESTYLNYSDKDIDIDQRNEQFQGDIDETRNRYENDPIKILEYSDSTLFGTKTEISLLPTFKPKKSKSNLASCMKEVLTFKENIHINPFLFANHKCKEVIKSPNNKYNDILGYGRNNDFLSCIRESEDMASLANVCTDDLSHEFIFDTPFIENNNKHNLPPDQIDYKSVETTLKEAKEFSGQLTQLLEKYDRANKHFQSVTKKIKYSPGFNYIDKLGKFRLEYIVIDGPNTDHDNSALQNTEAEGNIKIQINENKTQLTSLENIQSESEKKSIGRRINECSTNIFWDKMQNDPKNIKEQRSKETFSSISIKTKENAVEESGTLSKMKFDVNVIQRSEDKERDKLKATNKIFPITCEINNIKKTNAQTKIDNLTDQITEIIKDNVFKNFEEIHSTDVKKIYDNIEVYDDEGLKVQEKEDNSCDWSISKKNYYLNNNSSLKDSFTSPLHQVFPKTEMQSMAIQTSLQNNIHKPVQVIDIQSASSTVSSKTTQVEKQYDSSFGSLFGQRYYQEKNQRKSSRIIMTSIDSKQQPMFHMERSNRLCELTRSKCSCEDLKVCSMTCRRVSDHTVMVKWLKPKQMNGVQGYELLVDGRPVQKTIDSARCMAVVTCLPNCDKILITMRTVLDFPLKSGHKPTVTIVYHPRLKKNKNEDN